MPLQELFDIQGFVLGEGEDTSAQHFLPPEVLLLVGPEQNTHSVSFAVLLSSQSHSSALFFSTKLPTVHFQSYLAKT